MRVMINWGQIVAWAGAFLSLGAAIGYTGVYK